jgi:hypothetical protein
MLRSIFKLAMLAVLTALAWVGIAFYHARFSTERQVAQLQHDNFQLQQYVKRLTSERRVAEMLVSDQKPAPRGAEPAQTTLLFEEYGPDGALLPPRSFTIAGDVVHIDAMVIKFDHGLVQANDPLRGHSIALFHRLYGDHQAPAQGFAIDPPGSIPEFYRDADPRVSQFEQELWTNFWRLADDPGYRAAKGVRVANGQGVWLHVSADRLYTLSIESDGGLNYSAEPLKGIYREAMQEHRGD